MSGGGGDIRKIYMKYIDIDKKLEEYRTKWKNGEGNKETIKRQARALEIAKEIKQKRGDTV